MRSYTLPAGSIPDMAERWKEHLPGRTKLSPLTGVFTSDVGGLNQWLHIWAYKSLDQRARGAQEGRGRGHLAAARRQARVKQENKIVLAAPFSPIK